MNKRNSKRNLYFRADGSTSTGLGHLYRILAFAKRMPLEYNCFLITQSVPKAFKIKASEVFVQTFLIPEISLDKELQWIQGNTAIQELDCIIFDSYSFTQDYIKEFKTLYKTVYIDDLNQGVQQAHAIINHNNAVEIGEYELSNESTIYKGFKYLLLRDEFINRIKLPPSPKKGHLFLCFGGTDWQNLNGHYLPILLGFKEFSKIHILSSSTNTHWNELKSLFKENTRIRFYENLEADQTAELISTCEFALTSASTIAFECCCIGIKLLTCHYADNQVILDKYLSSIEVAVTLGKHNTTDSIGSKTIIEEFLKSKVDFLTKQQEIFGVCNSENLIEIIEDLYTA